VKSFFLVLFVAISTLHAETNTVLVTNLVTAADNFRVVNGQLYNIEKSKAWNTKDVVVLRHVPGGLIVQQYEDEEKYRTVPTIQIGRQRGLNRIGGGFRDYSDSDNREHVGTVRKLGEMFLLQNFKKDAADGEALYVWSMPNGFCTNGTQVIRVLDCGKPHVVPVVKTLPKK
jgi:hypothetical protein